MAGAGTWRIGSNSGSEPGVSLAARVEARHDSRANQRGDERGDCQEREWIEAMFSMRAVERWGDDGAEKATHHANRVEQPLNQPPRFLWRDIDQIAVGSWLEETDQCALYEGKDADERQAGEGTVGCVDKRQADAWDDKEQETLVAVGKAPGEGLEKQLGQRKGGIAQANQRQGGRLGESLPGCQIGQPDAPEDVEEAQGDIAAKREGHGAPEIEL